MISPSHLKKHEITGPEYKAKYPNSALRIQSTETRNKLSESKRGKEIKKSGPRGENKKLSVAKAGKPNFKLRGQKRTEEQRQNISRGTKAAMNVSEETKAKISAALQSYYQNGGTAPMTGKTHTLETKTKLSKASQNNKASVVCWTTRMQSLLNNQNIEFTRDVKGVKLLCNKCNSEFERSIGYFSESRIKYGQADHNKICRTCNPKPSITSAAESEVRDFIKSIYGGRVISNIRSIVAGELDIFLPDLGIAIEYNGLYWHSEKLLLTMGYDKKKDFVKYQHCTEKGIQLISIFEDEWLSKQEIVKSRLAQILKVSDRPRIHGRKCSIMSIDSETKNLFLKKYHLQGEDRSSIKLGAYYGDELVAVMTFKPSSFAKGGDGSVMELNRFATVSHYRIPGIASKLLTHFRSNYSGSIISYSDNRWSKGNVYAALGFKKISVTPPGYWYIVNDARVHRSAFMKHKLIEKLGDQAVGMTESQIMNHLNIAKIWDCGMTKWVL